MFVLTPPVASCHQLPVDSQIILVHSLNHERRVFNREEFNHCEGLRVTPEDANVFDLGIGLEGIFELYSGEFKPPFLPLLPQHSQ